jgi:hypothetical protein
MLFVTKCLSTNFRSVGVFRPCMISLRQRSLNAAFSCSASENSDSKVSDRNKGYLVYILASLTTLLSILHNSLFCSRVVQTKTVIRFKQHASTADSQDA